MAERLCAVSVDLDEIHHYLDIHGLRAPSQGSGGRGVSMGSAPDGSTSPSGPAGAAVARLTAVYDVALPRMAAWARGLGLPLTLFAVGADLARPEAVAALRALSAEGHEVGNHSLDHRYDLTRLAPGEQRRQVEEGAAVIAASIGQQPRGFRAPGYTVSDELLEAVARSGAAYDASVFPCPPYLLAKLGVLAAMAAAGRESRSIAGDPRVLLAPTRPYRLGRPYFRRGGGLVEIPVQVTPGPRLPFIGTAVTLAPAKVGEALALACSGEPSVNLELHGIDFLEEADGLSPLAAHQRDVRVPWAVKRSRLEGALGALAHRGFRFVTMAELARRAAG